MPDTTSLRLPVSIKAALVEAGRVCLLLNERDQWELPGGRLQRAETLTEGLIREVREELGLEARPERLLDGWVFSAVPGKEVLILVFGARLVVPGNPRLSSEHRAFRWCTASDLAGMRLPPGFAPVLQTALAADG